jgi:pilus assembly protein CpaC
MKRLIALLNRGPRNRVCLAALMTLQCSMAASAQQVVPAAGVTPRPQYERVAVTAGRSTVLPTDFDVTRIAITNPEIADAVVVQPREILVDGKKSGTVSLIVWGADTRRQYDIVVEPAITTLEQHLQTLFPGEAITVSVSEEAMILSGLVSSTAVMLRAGEIAASSSTKSKVINMLQVPGGSESQQVMLQVRFAEVNRKALTELGINLFVNRDRFAARSTTQQFAAPVFDDEKPGGMVFSDFLNLFFFDKKEGIGGVIKALEARGGFQSLAEPNLIAYNGQEASFLAGGEFPIPIVQGTNNAVTVEFKEFGIRLNFKPTIAGDVIRLKVRPEVSALDFANGISLGGFRIPALTTRRAETDVELRDGQSFAIAGLLDNIRQDDSSAIPILSKLPIIGYLFKSKAERAEETELMVLITPRLVRPLNPDEVPPLPTSIRPLINRGDIGQQLDGAGGVVDAPPDVKPVADKPRDAKPAVDAGRP